MKTIFFLLISLITVALFGQENIQEPFILKQIQISNSTHWDREGLIFAEWESRGVGTIDVLLSVGDKLKHKSENYQSSKSSVHKKSLFNRSWKFIIPDDGYYATEIYLGFEGDKNSKENELLSFSQSTIVYYKIENGKVVDYQLKPFDVFNQPPTLIEPSARASENVSVVPLDSSLLNKSVSPSLQSSQSISSTSAYSIYISISGQLGFNQTNSIVKGIPNIRLYLDWDYDNNPTTGYTPYGGNINHVNYADTDDNGNFYFLFILNSDIPANQYSSKIRIWGLNNNGAAFNGDRGNGASLVFINLDQFPSSIDISNSTTSIISQLSPKINERDGGALRYIYRAREFSTNKLGFIPNQIRYYYNESETNSFFCGANEIIFGIPLSSCGGSTITVPRIVFNRAPDSHLTYHEYGHFVEYSKVGFTVGEGEDHSFTWQTSYGTAWTEGWAEFYEGVSHLYFYTKENSSKLEYNSRGDFDGRKEFCDYAQEFITGGTGNDNTKVEGAIACFFYSLYDGVENRAPSYVGDNDDITFAGSFILNNLSKRYNINGQRLAPSHIESYLIALKNVLNFQQQTSLQALYNSLILQTGIAFPATPTQLQISGNTNTRTLTWNDNTAPSTYSKMREDGYTSYYDIVENDESGFRVYRKATSATWDETLNGYALVATVGQNVKTLTDNTLLTGSHSYVVVAYNSNGNSLPKAETKVFYSLPLSVSIFGPANLNFSQVGTFTANAVGGTSVYTYKWFYRNDGSGVGSIDFVALSDNDKKTKKNTDGGGMSTDLAPISSWFELLCYNSGGGSPIPCTNQLLFGYQTSFSIKCDVTDNSGSVVTAIHSVTVNGSNNISQLSGLDQFGGKVERAEFIIPKKIIMESYPNPFNPTTNIRFGLPQSDFVSISIYNISGQLIEILHEGEMSAGFHNVSWNGNRVASGVYFVMLKSTNNIIKQKIILSK